jgi:hypothetical protein
MKSERLTDTDIRRLGWQALVDRLGLTGALRFAMQTERGSGDYARDRHQTLGTLSVDQLVEAMRSAEPRRHRRRAATQR